MVASRADAREQLAQFEGLAEMAVSAVFEAGEPGHRLVEPGHQDDPGWRGECLEPPRDGEPCFGVPTTHNIGLTGR